MTPLEIGIGVAIGVVVLAVDVYLFRVFLKESLRSEVAGPRRWWK